MSVESRALRHVFFAERQASKIPDVPSDTPALAIKKAAVLGAGTMGGGIAMVFANAGIPVVLVDREQALVDKGFDVVRKNYAGTVKKGKLSQAEMDARVGRISGTTDWSGLADVDLVIEAVFEEMGLEEGDLRKARQDLSRVRDSRDQHVDFERRRNRGLDVAPRAGHWPPLFQPGQRDEAARNRARQADVEDRRRHEHEARENARQGRRARGGMSRLRRKPDAPPVLSRSAVPHSGGGAPAATRQGHDGVRPRDGSVCDQ